MRITHLPSPVALLGLLLSVTLLTACESYQIRGRVVEGPGSSVTLVRHDAARLREARGIGGVQVTAILDPHRLSRKTLGNVYTDADGYFAMTVEEFGAGVLEYDVQIIARLGHHAPAMAEMRLPSDKQRVLIMMAPGRDEDPRPADYLRETLQMGEPYMR